MLESEGKYRYPVLPLAVSSGGNNLGCKSSHDGILILRTTFLASICTSALTVQVKWHILLGRWKLTDVIKELSMRTSGFLPLQPCDWSLWVDTALIRAAIYCYLHIKLKRSLTDIRSKGQFWGSTLIGVIRHESTVLFEVKSHGIRHQ
jgi:hypothetical protein